MVEELAVRGGCSVVELIDDHDIEMVGRKVVEIGGIETLDRGEDVIEMPWAGPADPLLTERRIAQRVPEGGETLIENLVAVGNKQKSRTR